MKNSILLLLSLLGILFVLPSCSNDDVLEAEVKPQTECKTLLELKDYNERILSSAPTRGWFDRFLEVASCDILGAAAGIVASKEIIGFAGLTTGGTGAVVTGAICGSICGAAASNKAYRKARVSTVPKGTVVNEEDLLLIAYKAYLSNLGTSDEGPDVPQLHSYNYNNAYSMIEIPEKFEYIKRIGEDHNAMVNVAVRITENNLSLENVLSDRFDGVIPPVSLSSTELNNGVFDNSRFHMNYDKIVKSIDVSFEKGTFRIDKFFDEFPYFSARLERTLKYYIQLFESYPTNIREIAEITNDYIEIIERNDEFTNDEKEVIYAAVMVAIYSPQIWNGFE